MTLRETVEELTKELNLKPDEQFLVTAKIKRLIHHEKQSVYQRYSWYSKPPETNHLTWKGYFKRIWVSLTSRQVKPDPHLQWVSEILKSADLNHRNWMNKPDHEIVTWDIGTHKYEG